MRTLEFEESKFHNLKVFENIMNRPGSAISRAKTSKPSGSEQSALRPVTSIPYRLSKSSPQCSKWSSLATGQALPSSSNTKRTSIPTSKTVCGWLTAVSIVVNTSTRPFELEKPSKSTMILSKRQTIRSTTSSKPAATTPSVSTTTPNAKLSRVLNPTFKLD